MSGPAELSSHSFREVFRIFLRLGLTSFGGPVAHLAYFREEFVQRRRWLQEEKYAEIVALCQFLPGPASSQVGLAIGLNRAGYAGAAAAWLGFTMPSALALIFAAMGMLAWGAQIPDGLLHGLKLAAVAVVAHAAWSMGRQLCPDLPRRALMAVAAISTLLVPGVSTQLAVIAAAGVFGMLVYRKSVAVAEVASMHTNQTGQNPAASNGPSQRIAVIALLALIALLGGLPWFAAQGSSGLADIVDAFFRTGSLVFGGGHVVLPLLQAEVVTPGWVANDSFVTGYGLAQAVPGPLFTFAAYLGAAMEVGPGGFAGGIICLLAIFAPSFLLLVGVLPVWNRWRHQMELQAALNGVNAAVVGLLVAALYDPVLTQGIVRWWDVPLALMAFAGLLWRGWPSWLVVLGCALAGAGMGLLGL